MKTTTNFRTLRMVQLALFTAIIAVLALSPLGYINTLGMSITIIGVPVVIGAIVLGPISGLILGGVFGLTSFARCFGMDATGTILLGINPIATFIMCVAPRLLMGFLTGIIFQGLKKVDKSKNLAYALTSLCGSLLNTVLFLSALVLFFYNTPVIQSLADYFKVNNAFAFVIAVAGINAVVEALVCLVIATAVAKALDHYNKKSGY